MSANKSQIKPVIVPKTREAAPVIFIDGVADIAFGTSVCKMALHQANPNDNKNTEDRSVVANVIIPTAALVEMCVNILASMKKNKDVLKSNIESQNKRLFEMLEHGAANAEED